MSERLIREAREALRKARATMDCYSVSEGCHFLAICGDDDTLLFQQNASVTADGHTQLASALLDGLSVAAVTKAGG